MKNLAKHKIAVKTREVLVQANYQHLFDKTPSREILEQFKKEHRPEKVDFKRFKLCLDELIKDCLLYTSPSPRDSSPSRMPSSA